MGLAVQVAVFVMMTVVGLDLTVADFRRLLDQPRTPAVATLGQWFLLPLTAWAVAWLLPLPAHLFAGMILLAASPAGGISNYYSYLARADVALSVSLTPISSTASNRSSASTTTSKACRVFPGSSETWRCFRR